MHIIIPNADGKSKLLPSTRIVRLDGLDINLVTMFVLYNEQFILILRGNDPKNNAKGKFSPDCTL